jgi:hypothetical protein
MWEWKTLSQSKDSRSSYLQKHANWPKPVPSYPVDVLTFQFKMHINIKFSAITTYPTSSNCLRIKGQNLVCSCPLRCPTKKRQYEGKFFKRKDSPRLTWILLEVQLPSLSFCWLIKRGLYSSTDALHTSQSHAQTTQHRQCMYIVNTETHSFK